jgi:hypothetical protein
VSTRASVDHVSMAVAELQNGVETFNDLGFVVQVEPDGARAHVDNLELVVSGEPEGLRYIAIACDPPPPQADLPLRFVRRAAHQPFATSHPNTVLHLERTYIVVPDLTAAAERYARVLDMPLPPVQRGNVIKADMCVFQVGNVGIGVAQPLEPGPAQEALQRRGPGPFQVLFRVRSLAEAVRHMTQHGVQPARGTRNTGEAAVLVSADQARGVYVAFVGPE